MNSTPLKVLARALPAGAVAALIAGCGGSSGSSSSSGNGVSSKSASGIVQAAKTAAAKAASVHISGSIVSAGKPISLNMELVAGKGGRGTIAQEGFSIKLVEVDDTVYLNGSSAFYKHVAGAAAAQLLQGKWLKAPADSGELASLADLTNLSKLVDSALASHGKLARGSQTNIDGQPAVEVKDTTKGGTLYVATTGKPYPLELAKGGSGSGKVTFDRWDEPVPLKAPSNAIELSKLEAGG